jgi:hypothetical protein
VEETERVHVRAGGSRIHRIMACPRSLTAPESEAGDAAALGTTAHYVGDRCIMTGCDADHPSHLGCHVLGQLVTREMADAVQVYVDYVRGVLINAKQAGVKAHLFSERDVDWSKLQPPEPMKGSADCIIVIPGWRMMFVIDYKNGVQHVPFPNKQVRYYAVGALMSMPRELTKDIRTVQLVIVQPNAIPMYQGGPVQTEEIDVGDLIDFASDAMAAVRAGQDANAPAIPGDHCKYCGWAPDCTARSEYAVTQAQSEFEVLADDIKVIPIEVLSAKALLAEQIIARASAWLKDAKDRLEGELKAGTDVPGWKMVEKRATRVWNDEKALKAWALDEGLSEADIHTEPVLKSPAQIESLVGKKNLPKDLYSSVSSGWNLVPATSPKDAARISASDEFSAM